jgi:hypothetical protein
MQNSGPVNQSDIALGIQAAQIGAALRIGGSVSKAVQQIQGLCQPKQ